MQIVSQLSSFSTRLLHLILEPARPNPRLEPTPAKITLASKPRRFQKQNQTCALREGNALGQALAPRFAVKTAQRSKASSFAPPAREIFAPEDHRCSSLPRTASIPAHGTNPSRDAPRGQAGGKARGQPAPAPASYSCLIP
jgi:hypothetical protein